MSSNCVDTGNHRIQAFLSLLVVGAVQYNSLLDWASTAFSMSSLISNRI